jgi:hypothetical protein
MPLYKVKIEVEVVVLEACIENTLRYAHQYRIAWWDWKHAPKIATEVKTLDQVPENWLDQVPLNGRTEGRTCRQWLS